MRAPLSAGRALENAEPDPRLAADLFMGGKEGGFMGGKKEGVMKTPAANLCRARHTLN